MELWLFHSQQIVTFVRLTMNYWVEFIWIALIDYYDRFGTFIQ